MGECARATNACGFWQLRTCGVCHRGLQQKNHRLAQRSWAGGWVGGGGGHNWRERGGNSCMRCLEQLQCVSWQQSHGQVTFSYSLFYFYSFYIPITALPLSPSSHCASIQPTPIHCSERTTWKGLPQGVSTGCLSQFWCKGHRCAWSCLNWMSQAKGFFLWIFAPKFGCQTKL